MMSREGGGVGPFKSEINHNNLYQWGKSQNIMTCFVNDSYGVIHLEHTQQRGRRVQGNTKKCSFFNIICQHEGEGRGQQNCTFVYVLNG